MTAIVAPLRRAVAPMISRGLLLAASLGAATILIRARGLGVFGLLATVLLLGRVCGALLLGESQLALARRAIAARGVLALRSSDYVRIVAACAIAAIGTAAAVKGVDASPSEVAAMAMLAVVLTVVAALLRVASIKLAQQGHTSMSAAVDISVIAPGGALTFLITDLRIAAVAQILILLAVATSCLRYIVHGEPSSAPADSSPADDLVAWAVNVLPMLHAAVGPVLGVFGLDPDAVGLLAFAQRLSSAAPLILTGGVAAVLAAPKDRARSTTLSFGKWGGAAYALIAVGILAAWPVIRSALGVDEVGILVIALVLGANMINVTSGPVGQYCAVAGLQRLDFISLTVAAVALVPFAVFATSATGAAVGAVTVAAVRAITVWALIINADHRARRSLVARPSPVGSVTVD